MEEYETISSSNSISNISKDHTYMYIAFFNKILPRGVDQILSNNCMRYHAFLYEKKLLEKSVCFPYVQYHENVFYLFFILAILY